MSMTILFRIAFRCIGRQAFYVDLGMELPVWLDYL
jgi:hypothetical protein